MDYPEWTATGANSRSGMESLAQKMKRKAEKMGLRLVAEEETKYAPASDSIAS